MVITELKIESVIPYYNNVIDHKDDNLTLATEMMRKFGFNQPIIVDEAHVIICGHGRHKVAQRLGMKTVPCVVVSGFKPKEKRLYRILDNVVNKGVEWDWNNLAREFRALEIPGIPDSDEDVHDRTIAAVIQCLTAKSDPEFQEI